MTDDILELVRTMLHRAFTSFDEMAQKACDVLSTNELTRMVQMYPEPLTMWQKLTRISGTFNLFCNIIIGICMLIELSKTFSKVDVLKWEHGLKVGVKVVIAKVCIENSPLFLKACYNQAIIFITAIAGEGNTLSLGASCITDIDNCISNISGLGNAIGLLVSVLILQIGIKICGVIIVVMAYGRMFEIMLYILIAPIPCAFFPLGEGDNLSRIPLRFFKSYIAVCMQGVMMFLCIRLFSILINNAFSEMVDAITDPASGLSDSVIVSELCYSMLLFTIVLVMSVTKCSSWAKSIMDAG